MKFFSGRQKGTKGFTLIELMVVIAIIGLLASIITVSLTSARAKGRDAKRVADIRTIQLALEEYYNDNLAYPNSLNGLSVYLPSIPKDPKDNIASYFYTSYNLTAGTGNCLTTTNPVIKYHLAAAMETDNTTNPALNQDVDWNGDTLQAIYSKCSTGSGAIFDGNASLCVGASAVSPDTCYDVTN